MLNLYGVSLFILMCQNLQKRGENLKIIYFCFPAFSEVIVMIIPQFLLHPSSMRRARAWSVIPLLHSLSVTRKNLKRSRGSRSLPPSCPIVSKVDFEICSAGLVDFVFEIGLLRSCRVFHKNTYSPNVTKAPPSILRSQAREWRNAQDEISLVKSVMQILPY